MRLFTKKRIDRCILIVLILTMFCGCRRFKDATVILPDEYYPQTYVREFPEASVNVPLVNVKDSVLMQYVTKYINDNEFCFNAKSHNGIVIYSYDSHIIIGDGNGDRVSFYDDCVAFKINDELICVQLASRLLDLFFENTGDSVLVEGLFSDEQIRRTPYLQAQGIDNSLWEFSVENGQLKPFHIYIMDECATTDTTFFPPETPITHL